LIETIPLEEGLQRVADAFLDSPEAFMHGTQQLAELTHFISGLDERQRARAYLASAEPTIVEQIESARRELLQITDDPHSLFDVEQCRRFDLLWGEFKTRYVEHYAELHDRAVNSESYTDALSALLASDGWQEFEALSGLTILNRQAWMRAEELLKRASLTNCDLPVRQLLAERPQCFCSFRLTRADQSVRTAQKLEETMELGRTAYRRTLALLGKDLAHALDALAREPSAANVSDRARALAATWMEAGTGPATLTQADVGLIKRALEAVESPCPVHVHLPADSYGLMTRDELRARLAQWLDDLPAEPTLVEVASHNDNNAA